MNRMKYIKTARAAENDANANGQQLREDWFDALEAPLISGRRLTIEEFPALPRREFIEPLLSAVLRSSVLPLIVILGSALITAGFVRSRFCEFPLDDSWLSLTPPRSGCLPHEYAHTLFDLRKYASRSFLLLHPLPPVSHMRRVGQHIGPV